MSRSITVKGAAIPIAMGSLGDNIQQFLEKTEYIAIIIKIIKITDGK